MKEKNKNKTMKIKINGQDKGKNVRGLKVIIYPENIKEINMEIQK